MKKMLFIAVAFSFTTWAYSQNTAASATTSKPAEKSCCKGDASKSCCSKGGSTSSTVEKGSCSGHSHGTATANHEDKKGTKKAAKKSTGSTK